MRKIFFLMLIVFPIISFPQTRKLKFEVADYKSLDSLVSFRGIYAVDKDTVWVSGSKGSVYVTSDSGEKWQKVKVPLSDSLDFRDIEIISPGVIVLMSSGAGENSRIYKSDDNGKTWKIVFQNLYIDGFLDTIEFWDQKNGIAIGDPVNGKFDILLTTDSGNNWNAALRKNIPDAFIGEAQFAASGTCISVSGNNEAWIATGGTKARILKTTDKGLTWQVFETPILQGQSSTGIFSIHFLNKNVGLIVGGNYLMENNQDSTSAFSVNGGRTWQLNSSGHLPYQSSVKSININNQAYFISTGPAGTFYTNNLNNWQLAEKAGFHCMSISVKDNTIWLAGSNGRVAKLIIK
jgi:photosystem II stability/assembly factor-like uncharacterized protein